MMWRVEGRIPENLSVEVLAGETLRVTKDQAGRVIGINVVPQEESMSDHPQTADDRHTFSSGAKSSGTKPRYDLIPTWALQRIARRFELGAAKYGVDNWKKGLGDREFILDRINHAIDHLLIIRDRIRSGGIQIPTGDDDAAAVVLNAIFVMGYEMEQVLPTPRPLDSTGTITVTGPIGPPNSTGGPSNSY